MVRVFHCDDSHAYRRLIRGVLALEPGLELVGEATDRASLFEGLAATLPDVLLLDMVRGVTDADVSGEIALAAPGVSVIILSGHAPDRVDPGILTMAAAYVTKSTAFEALGDSIRDAAARTNVE